MSEPREAGQGPRRSGHRLVRWGATAAVHVLGLLTTAAVVGWILVGTTHLGWLIEMNTLWGEPSLYVKEFGVHLGIAACLWAMMYLMGMALWTPEEGPQRVVARAKGTVITETIIILPVFLTLLLGLSQLAVINVAAMLLNYGSNQAGRTVWLWEPEMRPLNDEAARRGVTEDLVERMARIQVAAALVPVAPAQYQAEMSNDAEAEWMRASLLATQLSAPTNDSGRTALDLAGDLNNFPSDGEVSFWQAMDAVPYPERTSRKFSFAYEALDVTVIRDGEEVGVDLTYQQKISFPWVGRIFGTPGNVGGQPGLYNPMVRTVMYPAQVPPNAELPPR